MARRPRASSGRAVRFSGGTSNADCLSGPQRADLADISRIERCRRRDEQPVALCAAEADVRHHLRNQDLAQKLAARGETVNAVAGAGPDIAVRVEPEAVGQSGADLGE